MRESESSAPAGSYIGHVKNGVVVLDMQVSLQEGQAVRVEPLEQEKPTHLNQERADRVRRLQQLFSEWTEEDAKLSDEDACLDRHVAARRGLLGGRALAGSADRQRRRS